MQDLGQHRPAPPLSYCNRPVSTWRRLCPALSRFPDSPPHVRSAISAHSSARSPVRRLPSVPGPSDRPIVATDSTVSTKHSPFRSRPQTFRPTPASATHPVLRSASSGESPSSGGGRLPPGDPGGREAVLRASAGGDRRHGHKHHRGAPARLRRAEERALRA